MAIWIFLFLILTEPLDTDEFEGVEKLKYLPLYGLAGALAYIVLLPLQNMLYRITNKAWTFISEFLFHLGIFLFGLLLTRSIYLYIVVPGAENPYSLYYFITDIYVPAIATILPILIIGRWAAGRYYEKKLDNQKIEIEGEGTYEGLRLQLNNLVCIKAEDNYVEVSYFDNGTLKKQLIRNKLSKVEAMMPELVRTHRSYLINPYHFQQFKMESGKLTIILGSELVVPVSKTYSDTVKSNFQ